MHGHFVVSFPYFNGNELVPYTFVSVNRRNNEARVQTVIWARASLFRRFTNTNVYGTVCRKLMKLSRTYTDIFYSVRYCHWNDSGLAVTWTLRLYVSYW